MKIEVAASIDYYDEAYYYTRGWVDKTEFLEAIMAEYGDMFDLENDDADDATHGYVRIYKGKEDNTIYFDESHLTHRGCFKATYIYVGM